MTDKPEVRVKWSRYQPSAVEPDKPVTIRRTGGTVSTPEELARTPMWPMRFLTDPDARGAHR